MFEVLEREAGEGVQRDVARQKIMIFSEGSYMDPRGVKTCFCQAQHRLRHEIMKVWIRTSVVRMGGIGHVLEVLHRITQFRYNLVKSIVYLKAYRPVKKCGGFNEWH